MGSAFELNINRAYNTPKVMCCTSLIFALQVHTAPREHSSRRDPNLVLHMQIPLAKKNIQHDATKTR